jgi:hypothetical protein
VKGLLLPIHNQTGQLQYCHCYISVEPVPNAVFVTAGRRDSLEEEEEEESHSEMPRLK